MSKPDRHKYCGHYVCSLAPCLPDPHGLSKRRACLGVNTFGHKYCIPLIIRPLAYPERPASSSVAGQMRTFPECTSRLGTPLKFPRCLGIPSPAGLGRECGRRGARGARGKAGQPEKAPAARSAQYLLSCHAEGLRENPIWHAGKGFQLYLPPCKYPRVPDWGDFVLHRTI